MPDLEDWNNRHRSQDEMMAPTPLVVETVRRLQPGRALDLASGTGRNALWLAENGWRVTAVDGSVSAIEKLRARHSRIETHLADLTNHEFEIVPSSWDLILMCYYLQRDLFEAVKSGVAPGGIAIVIVHISEPGEPSTERRLVPGELAEQFRGWEILHSHEGVPRDSSHRRISAEMVARRVTP